MQDTVPGAGAAAEMLSGGQRGGRAGKTSIPDSSGPNRGPSSLRIGLYYPLMCLRLPSGQTMYGNYTPGTPSGPVDVQTDTCLSFKGV